MKKLWLAFTLVLVVSFAVLGWVGTRIHDEAPPIVDQVVTTEGAVVIGAGEVLNGQNVWQSLGGMEVGSVWGHGSYVAPDWTADYLHREARSVLDQYAQQDGGTRYDALPQEAQAALRERLRLAIRTSGYDAATRTLTLPPQRAQAFRELEAYYAQLFREGRREFAIPAGAQSDPQKLHLLTSFYFWTAWAAGTDRTPGISYTNN